MSDITSALQALATLLKPIAPVRTGRAALETTSADLPVITLTSLSDTRSSEQTYDAGWSYTRRAIIEYRLTALDDYPDAMDSAAQAIRAALVPDAVGQWLDNHADSLRETAVTFLHPEPHGTDAALQIIIDIDYSE
jgi:hypothetical protein